LLAPRSSRPLSEENLVKKTFVAAAALSVAAVVVPTAIVPAVSAGASSASAGTQFIADSLAKNFALNGFNKAFAAWESSKSSTFAESSSFVDPYVTALQAYDHKLLTQSWPAASLVDIDTLVENDGALEGDLLALPELSTSSSSSWLVTSTSETGASRSQRPTSCVQTSGSRW
jgi:hypothetical protein